MENYDALKAEIKVLRERLARFGEASLRIGESLEIDTALREIIAGACALAGAGYGGIAAWDSEGALRHFVTHGVSDETHQQFLDLPYGENLWAYLREVDEPVRFKDLSAHFVSLGFPEDPLMAGPCLGMPIRHRGVQVGSFYLRAKASGQEFTEEDEGILALFASLAGVAIVNAVKHNDEKQARADLEALVDTSPVGVVVFDARSGRLVSHNREMRRIIGDLCKPGAEIVELLEVLTLRTSDGNEIPPVAYQNLVQMLRESILVRAEEIHFEFPDGRKVTTLVNATPIISDQDEILSVVVTMQDMTPIEEQERQRTEFLSMVSHELTAPLVSIKGCSSTAMESVSGLSAAESQQFFRIINTQAEHMRRLIGDLMDSAQIETGSLSLSTEPADLVSLVDQAKTMFYGGGRQNTVQIDLPQDLPRVRADRHRIVQVLLNLLTNAARHSPDSAAIRVVAEQKSVYVEVSVIDEGPGIPSEQLSHLFRKYVRSGGEDRGIGAGIGLAICKGLVEAHGGRIWAQSEGTDLGRRFTFSLPVVEKVNAAAGLASRSMPLQPGRPDRQKPHILAVDDDPQALGYIRETIEKGGYRATVTGDPKKVKELIDAHQPDLLLLDLLLPGTDGIKLMGNLPKRSDRPVIFLSAYGRDETIAKALQFGAADYIVKPFSPTELIARIEAALRKYAGTPEPFRSGELVINYEERLVELAGNPLRLTATEFDVLRILSTHAGRVVTYDQLLSGAWQMRNSGDARVVRVFVKKLRQKLGDDARNPTYIFTEPRVGYRMARAIEPVQGIRPMG